ncbi:MAG: hypothetical protein OK456_08420 [Thaumarchaeota archaeon]|nr:hypothetical protein [Nitrososphaerota archaeon]
MKGAKRVVAAVLLALLMANAFSGIAHPVSAYTPQAGDNFTYSETITVNNGQGSYSGYTDQLTASGVEQVNSVSGSNVTSSYSYSYQYSNSQGSSTASSSAGNYTWSTDTFTYVNGTDNEGGFGGTPYSSPLYVWFAIDPSLPVGSSLSILNSQFSVISKNYSFDLTTENRYVQTIEVEGTGTYQRNDAYGDFTASYTWFEYFDPATGYIVGYDYVEQDTGQYQGQTGSFTYTDQLNVASTSHPLTAASAPTSTGGSGASQYLGYVIAAAVILLLVGIGIYAGTRRRKAKESLPEHSPPPPPSSTPFESTVDLGSNPPEQVVIREVAMVKCKYCGTLIPSTAGTCPYCGGPQG